MIKYKMTERSKEFPKTVQFHPSSIGASLRWCSFCVKEKEMRDFAKGFYKSKTWQKCRESYLNKARGLCEECLRQGLYTPADTVHHKIHLSPKNINDPSITLSFDNLEAVCRDCHANLHKSEKRYRVDEFGHVIVRQ